MKELIQRLRDVELFPEHHHALCSEAADALERMQKVCEFAAKYLDEYDNPVPDYTLRVMYRKQMRERLAALDREQPARIGSRTGDSDA